jgi:AcrR family transcriptional regulator
MEKGYAATSIDDVARRLGATKGRIYHHFASKADLFAEIFRTGMDMNFEALAPWRNMAGTATERWVRMATIHTGQMIRTQPFQRVVWEGVEMHLRGSTTPEQRSAFGQLIEYRTRYGNIFRDLIDDARLKGEMRFDNLSIANQIMFMTLNSPIIWYSPRPDETPEDLEQIVRQVVEFALRGLGGKAGAGA